MFANIWLTSALTVTAIFSASAIYKSYSDLQEAKQIQESFQIITDIKTLLAKQYNKNPQDITRDEIITYLPSGGNWEKVLLLDRNSDSNLSEDELINEDGKLVLDESEKIKLLAVKAKLRDTLDTSSVTVDSGKYTFEVGYNENIKEKDKVIEDSLSKVIYYMTQKSIYGTTTLDATELSNIITSFIPLDSIYQDLTNIGETTDSQETKKRILYKELLKIRLEKNENTQEAKLYKILKDIL